MQRSRLRRCVALGVTALVGLLAFALRRAGVRARDVPLSTVTAGWYVGPDFVERAGLATDERPSGELDDVGELARDGFNPDRLHPEVARFYEQTAEYEMRYRATWHEPYRTGAALASVLTSRIEQLNLPGTGDQRWHELESRFVGVDEPGTGAAGREDVRAWIRTDPTTGEAVFVALYGTQPSERGRLVNIAAPLPRGNVSTVLRPEYAETAVEGGTAIRFSTRGPGDPGLYLQTPAGPVELPMEQEFRVWPAPATVDWDLGAVHEMWLFGRRLLTVDYRIRRGRSSSGASPQ